MRNAEQWRFHITGLSQESKARLSDLVETRGVCHMAESIQDYFWSRVSPEPNSGCWLWAGTLSHGYGEIRFRGRRPIRAHRFSWELINGPIPDGLVIDHRHCRMKCCVNPIHMALCTLAENVAQPDGSVGKQLARTHCPQGHLYSTGNTRFQPNGRRMCRTCCDRWPRNRPISEMRFVSARE